MSDTVPENEGFHDIEAQSPELPLLGRSPSQGRTSSSSSLISSNFNPKEALLRAVLVITSVVAFKSRINSSAAGSRLSSSSSSSSSSLSLHASPASPDQNSIHQQNSEILEEDTLSSPPASSITTSTITRVDINDIVRKKNLQRLRDIGGIERVEAVLKTDPRDWVSGRRNTYPHRRTQPCTPQLLPTIFHSLREAINTITILLLTVAATLFLVFGLTEDGSDTLAWLNGAVLFSTIFFIVICTTAKNCWEKLSKKKLKNSWRSKGRNMEVQVVRGGRITGVSESDLEVGDIAVLRKGDHVPADGLFVSGQSLEIDKGLSKPTTIDAEHHPFLLYGWKVINGGEARMLVTSARMETAWGERMSQAMEEAEENECKFESRLYKWYNCTNIAGICLSILLVIVVFLHRGGKLNDERRFGSDTKGEPIRISTIMNAIKEVFIGSKGTARVLTTLLSVSLIGVTEGMAFVVTFATIIWSREILAHKALERDYVACLKMASVTTICTDKFGGLTTEDGMEIDKFCLGGEIINESSMVPFNVLECLFDGIVAQSPPELRGDVDSKLLPLTSWAEARLGMKSEAVIEQCKPIRDRIGDNLFEGCCQVVIEKNEGIYLHCGGPLQEILQRCSLQYCVNGQTEEMDEGRRSRLEQINERMKAENARVIAYAYKRLDNTPNESSASNLTFVGMISMKETKLEDTRRAVSNLRDSGVQMIVVSGDNIAELRTIGEKCGIIADNPGDMEVLDAEVFRGWTYEEKMQNADKIRIMGNCIPLDKTDLIKCLRKKGQEVGFLGQRVMDAPALKQADVGIAVGTWSSTVAMESCDISIREWEGNCISFLVHVIQKARCFEENIRKLVQLQLIFTCSSSLINFAATVFFGDAPMNAVEVFWLNVAVPLGGGLALLTGPLAEAPTNVVPINSSEKVITTAMWRNMAIQVVYLSAIFLALERKGEAILKGISGGSLQSMIYNGFFMCQMFITLISRELEKKNILRGVCHENKWFWAGLILLLICQAMFAVAERFFGSFSGLSWEQWGWCLLIGLGCVLMDWVGKIVHGLISLLGRMMMGSWERLQH